MGAWLERNAFLVIAVAGMLLLAGLGVGELRAPAHEPAFLVTSGGLEPGTPIRVHVAGAVISPGVYSLAAGDRVEDAVASAGGPAPGADLGRINLARRLRDGEQVVVAGATGASAVLPAPGEVLDLNAATQEQLIALPGIGEAYSRRIIDSRVVDGPFRSVDDVVERGLVPARTLNGIRAMVTVSLP